MNVLNRRTGIYLDVTDMPKSYAEMYQRIMDAEAYFKKLPLNIREKFNHSPQEFFAAIGTPMWNEVFGRDAQNDSAAAMQKDADPVKGGDV